MIAAVLSVRGAWLASRFGRFTASSDIPQAINPKRRLSDDELIRRKLDELRMTDEEIAEKVEGGGDGQMTLAADLGHHREEALVAAVPGATHNAALIISKLSPALAATPDGMGKMETTGEPFIVEVKTKSLLVSCEYGEAFKGGEFPDTPEGRKYEAQLQAQMWVCGVKSGCFVVQSSEGVAAGDSPFIGAFSLTDEWRERFEAKALPLAKTVEEIAAEEKLEFRVFDGVDY